MKNKIASLQHKEYQNKKAMKEYKEHNSSYSYSSSQSNQEVLTDEEAYDIMMYGRYPN